MTEFRYWGSRDPRGRSKLPILAAVPEPVTTGDSPDVTTLRLYDPIDSWGDIWGTSAQEFAQALDAVTTPNLTLHINSPGGEVFDAIAILNMLRQHSARVTAVVDGLAASAASFIACGCDELVMAPNSQLMIHDAWGIGVGPAATMRELADRLDAFSNNIAAIYAAKAGGSVAAWREPMLAETWYSPEQAIAAGLADSIAGEAPTAVDTFDLSAFRASRSTPVQPAAAEQVAPDVEQLDRARRFNERRMASRTVA